MNYSADTCPCVLVLYIEGELEHLRSVLKMNGYPKKFIDNAMKTRQHVREKTEYQSSVSLPYTGSASHKSKGF